MPSRRPTVPEAFGKAVELLQAERIPFVVIGGLAAGLRSPYLRKWADWLAAKNPEHLGEVPGRLEAVLARSPLPPAARG
jgi:hypothetical protein